MAIRTQTQTHAPWSNATQEAPRPQLGLDARAETGVVDQMEQALIDTYSLYVKTQNAHWNVTGPMFHSLHGLFEEQYQELAGAVDTIAERIRTLGRVAPATLKEFSTRHSLKEWDQPPKADTMINDLVKDHEILIACLRDLNERAHKAEDEASVDLAAERLRAHEKAAWMLRVHLE